jgi:EAL domain-containing protein (putative c-di-GMP-specific phosphodiesterase class I)
VGAEAIVRWRSDGTIIPPEHFMSALSETHLWDLTIYSLRRAIREMVEFGSSPPVAVNIVQSVLEHPSFLKSVQNELNIWDLAPSRLAFEIAESQAIHDDKNMLGLLETLREMGIGVIIDEFGTGHASLEKIRDLPADQIKIDRRFVTNVCENSDDQRITETIIDLAHRFSMTVVADGVEDAETFGYLMEANCDVGQGFYLGAPLNNSQFAGLLKDLA